jgi:hypothetical protein
MTENDPASLWQAMPDRQLVAENDDSWGKMAGRQ